MLLGSEELETQIFLGANIMTGLSALFRESI